MMNTILAYLYFPIDRWYYILVVPALIFSLYAQLKVKRAFSKYSGVQNRRGITGQQVANDILQQNNIHSVRVERVAGSLTDHYSPKEKLIRLSEPVHSEKSIAALGVAAHEAGHAVQYAVDYAPIRLRSIIYPLASIGSSAGPYLAFLGLLMQLDFLFTLGLFFFGVAVAFYLVTLPVEFDASKRAIAVLEEGGYLSPEELRGAKAVLKAAALTYVASALTAFASLLRLIMLRNNSRR